MKYEIDTCNYIHDKDEYRLESFYLKLMPNNHSGGFYHILVNYITNDEFELYITYSYSYVIKWLKKFLKKINVKYYLYKLNVRINKENLDKLTFFCKLYGV